ncbi:MAG: DUF3299 domain-containing protein [Caulobacteraceae bacterium]|nr:DUF3299 domain-containing protein [Caulobacteraceae bacterium]
MPNRVALALLLLLAAGCRPMESATDAPAAVTPGEMALEPGLGFIEVPLSQAAEALENASAADPLAAELAEERAMQLNLPTADGPMWRVLRQTRITIDERSQLFQAAHPQSVRDMAGGRITLQGYMLPLESSLRTRHFLISPYTPVCFFHPPAEPNEVIEVTLRRPIPAGYHRVEVTGVLTLADNGEKGLFFQMNGATARIVERVDG